MLLRQGEALAKFDGWSYKFRRELLLLTQKLTRTVHSSAKARNVVCSEATFFHVPSISSPFLSLSLELFPEEMAKGKDPVEEIPRKRILEERPAALSEPLPREKLPKDLQKIVDKDDDWWEQIYDGQYDSLGLRAAI